MRRVVICVAVLFALTAAQSSEPLSIRRSELEFSSPLKKSSETTTTGDDIPQEAAQDTPTAAEDDDGAAGDDSGEESNIARDFFKMDGFSKAFMQSVMMIFATEVGDKTFFIAAIMAMRHGRSSVLLGALSALWIMTIMSVFMGYALPQLIPRSLTHILAALLFLYFGVRLLIDGITMKDEGPSEELEEVERDLSRDLEEGEPATTTRAQENFKVRVVRDAFVLTFLAEWGDRSQIATIALAAAQQPIGVIVGGCAGHSVCTGVAVIGGRMLASSISEKTVTIVGGSLFLVFALHEFFWG